MVDLIILLYFSLDVFLSLFYNASLSLAKGRNCVVPSEILTRNCRNEPSKYVAHRLTNRYSLTRNLNSTT